MLGTLGCNSVEKVVELFAKFLLLGCGLCYVGFELGVVVRDSVVFIFGFEEEGFVVS